MIRRVPKGIVPLAALCALVLVSAAAFRGLTGMEFRTALIVREILQRGPALVPRLDGTPYVDYPPLYFLAAALSSRLFGAISPLSLALPSILAAMGTVTIVSCMTERERPGAGLSAGTALLLTPLFFIWSSQGTTDTMLVFFTTLTLAACRRYALSGAGGALALAGLGIAGGMLTKGPIGAAIPLCAASVWLLLQKRFRACVSLLLKLGSLFAALAAIWASAIFLMEGWIHLERLMGVQFFDRVGEAGNHPRHYYVWVSLGWFAPWSLLAPWRPFRRSRPEPKEFDLFCAAWFLSTFALLTLASTTHSRYLLPAAPPVAVLAALFMGDLCAPGASSWASVLAAWIRRACPALLAVAAIFAAAGPLFLPAASPLLWAVIPALCLLPLAALALRGRDALSLFALLAWTLAVGLLLYSQFDLPRMTEKEEARPFVRSVEDAAGGRRIIFYGIGKNADGLKFLYWREGRNPLEFTDSLPRLAGALGGGPPALLVVRDRDRKAVEGEFGSRLRFLFEGLLGKRRCAVFEAAQ